MPPQNYVATASILRISDTKTLELIDLYRKEECLWNTQLEEYRCKMKRKAAAHRIARALNIPNFGAGHVLMKFKNLRNSYSQELKKIAKSRASGAGEYQPTVFWFSKLDSFIRPHLQAPRGGRTNFVYLLDGNESFVNTNSEDGQDPEAPGSETEETSRKRRTHHDFIPHSKRLKTDIGSEVLNPLSQSEDAKTAGSSVKDLGSHSHVEDYFDSFGRYIAGLLRTLPHQKALEVQPQIVGLVAAAALESAAHHDAHLNDCDVTGTVVKSEH